MSALQTILAQPMITHDLVQGTPEWDAFRLQHRGASEAAAMLGLSKKVTRTELLHAKHTGIAREFSRFVQERVLDKGHEVEALARPHAEARLGQELYPVTCSRGILSASCDGLTFTDEDAFEHKQWNDELAALVAQGIVPDEHMPQCQQILLVTDAKRVHFTVSDGTPERMVVAVVEPDRGWWERIAAGWAQFDVDLATYRPQEAAPVVQAAPIESLPAVSVRMDGALAVVSNLPDFAARLREFVAKIPTAPATDQEFADCDAACKALKKAEESLDAAEANALGQVKSVEELTRTIADLRKVASTARLASEKLVKRRKEEIKAEQVQRGKDEVAVHIAGLNERLGRPYMPALAPVYTDFAGAISGLKKFDSLRGAINDKVAAAKIEANRIADAIDKNLRWLRENAQEYKAIFPAEVTSVLVLKPHDDMVAQAQNKINEHKQAEEQRLADDRERIRREEERRAEAAEAEKNQMRMSEISGIQQQVLIATLGRAGVRKGGTIECIRETLAETEAWEITQENFGALTTMAQGAKDQAIADIRQLLADKEAAANAPAATPAPPATAATPAQPSGYIGLTNAQPPAETKVVAANTAVVVPMRAAAPVSPPTLTLGALGERFGFTVTADFMKRMGFEATKVKTASLFHEADVSRMIDSIVAHLRTVQEQQQAA